MPVAGQPERAAAYHGSEPDVIGAMLAHAVVRMNGDAESLHSEITGRLARKEFRVGGSFGDYGDSDGSFQAAILRRRLENAEETRAEADLFNGIVFPQNERRLKISSTESGVQFLTEIGGETLTSMFIPNSELTDYIVTLIHGGGGRTSPQAMLAVVNELIYTTK